MNNPIDPSISCVFKAVLGAVQNQNLLVNFLNSFFKPDSPVISVEVLNPYNPEDHDADDFDVINFHSNDANGPSFIGEIRIDKGEAFYQKAMVTLMCIYGEQNEWNIRDAKSCWILNDTVPFKACEQYAQEFQFTDNATGFQLDKGFSMNCADLAKWHKPDEDWDGADYWMYFFKEGKNFATLPEFMQDKPHMVQAFAALQAFAKPGFELDRYETLLHAGE